MTSLSLSDKREPRATEEEEEEEEKWVGSLLSTLTRHVHECVSSFGMRARFSKQMGCQPKLNDTDNA